MSGTNISALIREILAEELTKINVVPPTQGPEENPAGGEFWVAVDNDRDLNAFAREVLSMVENQKNRSAFEQGNLVFRLKGQAGNDIESTVKLSNAEQIKIAETMIESGFLSERQVDRLPHGIKRLRIGKTVKMTPMARDRLRQRGIIIERMDT